VLLLLLVLAASSVLVAKAANCSAELEAAGAAGTGVTTEWIDAATPDTACTAQLCTDDFDTCNVASPPLSTLQANKKRIAACVRYCSLFPSAQPPYHPAHHLCA
jgi:hypothetical protein